MVDIEIGDCPEHLHLCANYWAYFCEGTKKIYLGETLTDQFIVRVLNHETIHSVLSRCVGKKASKNFDNLFKHGVNSVASDGSPK